MKAIDREFWISWEQRLQRATMRTGYADLAHIHTETMKEYDALILDLSTRSSNEVPFLLGQIAELIRAKYRERVDSLANRAVEHHSQSLKDRAITILTHYMQQDSFLLDRLNVNLDELEDLDKDITDWDLGKLKAYSLGIFRETCLENEKAFLKPFQRYKLWSLFFPLISIFDRDFEANTVLETVKNMFDAKFQAYYAIAFWLGYVPFANEHATAVFSAVEDIGMIRKMNQICGRKGSV